jgi:hypothetical protein
VILFVASAHYGPISVRGCEFRRGGQSAPATEGLRQFAAGRLWSEEFQQLCVRLPVSFYGLGGLRLLPRARCLDEVGRLAGCPDLAPEIATAVDVQRLARDETAARAANEFTPPPAETLPQNTGRFFPFSMPASERCDRQVWVGLSHYRLGAFGSSRPDTDVR